MKKIDWVGAGLAATLGAALYWIFQCHHTHSSFPITRGGFTYITCTGCGAHRLYDTKAMAGYGPWAKDLANLSSREQPPRLASKAPAG